MTKEKKSNNKRGKKEQREKWTATLEEKKSWKTKGNNKQMKMFQLLNT